MKKIMFAMALLLSLVSVVAHAQEENTIEVDSADYNRAWYVGVDVGFATKATHNAWLKNINPSVGFRFGKWLSPMFGLEAEADLFFSRKQLNTWKSGWLADPSQVWYRPEPGYTPDYKDWTENEYGEIDNTIKAFSLGLNANANLSNIFYGTPSQPRKYEVLTKIGVAYGHDNARNLSTMENIIMSQMALNFAYNFGSKRQMQVYAEPSINWDIYDDRARGTYFDGGTRRFIPKYIIYHSDRVVAQVKLGFNYRFVSHTKKVTIPVEPPVVEEPKKVEPVEPPVVVPPVTPPAEPKKVEAVDTLREVFFYEIRLSDPTSVEKLNKIAAWCKRHADKKVTIDSYADRETGNPRLNVGYAKARATKCAKELEKLGVPRSQMIVNSYGDTVQPYAENDKNRCTIVVGK